MREKARWILDNDRITLTRLDPDNGIAYGTVYGGHGTYTVRYHWVHETFSCTCKWGKQKASFSQHLCSHAEALRIIAGF